jgi:S-adenosylmethionine hydrolase
VRLDPPLITLLTDFGDQDGYVGAMKGVILSRCRNAQIIDLAHGVPPQDVAAGARALARAALHFPPGTLHVAVVDPGVGSERHPVVVESDAHVFIGPDNGLLTLAAPPSSRAHLITNPAFLRANASRTFHGRDVFAAAAGTLAAGAAVADAGPRLEGLRPLPPLVAAAADGSPALQGTVVGFDRFGNALTDLSGQALPQAERALWFALFRADGARAAAFPLVPTYASVPRGDWLSYVGSDGFVEIAIRDGNAQKGGALEVGDVLRAISPGTADEASAAGAPDPRPRRGA